MRICAVKQCGSARVLHGLTGRVIALHPLAPSWVKVHLDTNLVTPYREWSVPEDRLVLCDDPDGIEKRDASRMAEVAQI